MTSSRRCSAFAAQRDRSLGDLEKRGSIQTSRGRITNH